MNILVVEDEILIAQTIEGYLTEYGHHTQAICISYQEAVAAYRKQVPDLVLLDIRLYGEPSGVAFAEFLNQQPEKVPFIYLTSQEDARAVKKALQTTPHGYLPKPIHKKTLWTNIEAAYQLAQSRAEDISLTIPEGRQYHNVYLSNILYLETEHIYTKVYLRDKETVICRKPLDWFLMQADTLLQTHRSYLVHPKAIRRWNTDTLVLIDGTEIPVSRSRKKEIKEELRKYNA